MRHITIRWDAPRSIEQVRLMRGRDDYGLFQIYGNHPEFGANALLYIGRAGAGEDAEHFGNRFLPGNQQFVEEYCAKGGRREELRIRIGRVHCEKYTGERYWKWPEHDWIQLVRDATAILVYHHYERLQNKRREKWKQSLSIENTGDFGSLDKRMSYEAPS